MPTQLHRDIRFHREEIALIKRTIAKVETGRGPAKQGILDGLHDNLRVHEEMLAELEKKLAEGT